MNAVQILESAENYINQENPSRAEECLEKFLIEKDNANIWRELAHVKIILGKELEAIAILKFVIPKLNNVAEWEIVTARMPLTRCVVESKHKILYAHVPKCGSSSIKDLIHFIRSGEESKETSHFHVNDLYQLVDRLEIISKFEDWDRILIVRDPIERLRSYYQTNIRDKLSLKGEKNGLKSYLGLSTQPTYSEVLTNFGLYRQFFADFRHHTNSISAMAGINANNYNMIKDISETNFVLNHIAVKGSSSRSNFENMKSKTKVDLSGSDLALEEEIKQFYKQDYETYGKYFL